MIYLKNPTDAILIEKKSQFISRSYPCNSLADFEKLKNQMSTEFSDCRHLAWAYRILVAKEIKIKFYDAGEPSGTAGKPILNHLDKKNIVNTVVFVARYFGGIKLGAGGLIRAYGSSVKLALEQGVFVKYTPMTEIKLELPYNQQNNLEYELRKYHAEVLEKKYGHLLQYTIKISEEDLKKFLDETKFINLI
tara:strand:- start:596 stop:1171 length:576 start_codon:yes stop_codon:yes gene_type:complete